MGVVYKARHLALKRVVALKMIGSGIHAEPHELARFKAEAEAVARLQHPNIVQVYEVGEWEGVPFCALEFIEGGSLAQRLSGRPLPSRDAALLVEAVASAMHVAHSRNVVHRDLKPANVLLAADGTPKVTDFGLARQLDADSGQTRAGVIMGTPSYMAPEQATGQAHAAGPATDVYALGAILYECLTGEPPFRGATVLETLEQVRSQAPVTPRTWQPRVPRDLETICLKCLQKEPERRYSSARELADDLGRFLRGEPVLARPMGPVQRTIKWARRRPAVAALLLALLVLAVGSTAVPIIFRLNAEAARVEQAEQRERLAREALEQVEDTLAENLMLPLGYDRQLLTPAELEALHRLAESNSDRVRLRFLEKALARPDTAARLSRRSAVAVHGAVGLSQQRREVVVRLLLEHLRDNRTATDARLACVYMGVALELEDAAFCQEAARAAVDILVGPTDPIPLYELLPAVESLAPRLPPGEAAAAGRKLQEAMAKTKDDNAITLLIFALKPLAACLPSEETPAMAQQLLDVIVKTTDMNARYWLVGAYRPLVERLTPKQAGDAAQALLDTMKTTAPMSRWIPAQALGSLVSRLPQEEARRVASATARELFESLNTSRDLSLILEPLAPHLTAEEVASAAQKMLDTLARTTDRLTLSMVVHGLRPLAERLNPQHARAAAQAHLAAMKGTSSGITRTFSAQALGLLAARLPREEAHQVAAAAARNLLDPVAPSRDLATTLEALAPQLAPEDAATSAQKLLGAMARPTSRVTLPLFVPALRPLTERLTPQQASAAAQTLLGAMKTTPSDSFGDFLSFSAQAAGLLAARLPPVEARSVAAAASRMLVDSVLLDPKTMTEFCGAAVEALAPHLAPEEVQSAARKLVDALSRTPDQSVRGFSQALAILAARLSPEEASRLSATAVPQLLDGQRPHQFFMGDHLRALAARLLPEDARKVVAAAFPKLLDIVARNPRVETWLAQALGSLAAGLTAEEASKVLGAVEQKLIESMFTTEAYGNLPALAEALASLAARLTPEETIKVSTVAAQKLVDAMARATIRGMVHPGRYQEGSNELIALAARLNIDGVVDLLKRPTCVGGARRALLRELSRRLGPPAPEAAGVVAQVVAAIPSAGFIAAALIVQGESLNPGGRRPFANQWEAVDWLSKQHPDIDLSGPLSRPAPPAGGARK
jgi:hypothetical protein